MRALYLIIALTSAAPAAAAPSGWTWYQVGLDADLWPRLVKIFGDNWGVRDAVDGARMVSIRGRRLLLVSRNTAIPSDRVQIYDDANRVISDITGDQLVVRGRELRMRQGKRLVPLLPR